MRQYETGKRGATNAVFESGSQRDDATGRGRYDLLYSLGMERLAQLYERGAIKYGDRNWEKGQPLYRLADSLTHHLWQYLQGVEDGEDHLAAVAWNAFAMLHNDEAVRRGLLPATLVERPGWLGRADERGSDTGGRQATVEPATAATAPEGTEADHSGPAQADHAPGATEHQALHAEGHEEGEATVEAGSGEGVHAPPRAASEADRAVRGGAPGSGVLRVTQGSHRNSKSHLFDHDAPNDASVARCGALIYDDEFAMRFVSVALLYKMEGHLEQAITCKKCRPTVKKLAAERMKEMCSEG